MVDGVILNRKNRKFIKFDERHEIEYVSDWHEATQIDSNEWKYKHNSFIEYHELEYCRKFLEFISLDDAFSNFANDDGEEDDNASF